MLHHMKLQQNPFDMIRSGRKKIEIRLNDEKRQQVCIGDTIEFSLIDDPTQHINVVVEDLHHFATFKDLCYAFPPQEYGSESAEEYSFMYQYYSKEDEAKYGVLGIRVKCAE